MMAKVKKSAEEVPTQEQTKKSRSILDKYRKQLGGVPMSESKLGEVPYWIDTGDLGLNRIISGETTKGIPAGRVVLFGGASQSGKSLVMSIIAGNAMNHPTHPVHAVFFFDSEGGAMKTMFEAMFPGG